MEDKEGERKIPHVQLQALKQLRSWPSADTSGKPFESHKHVHMDALSSASTCKVKQLPNNSDHNSAL